MPDVYTPTGVEGSVPGQYRQVLYWTIKQSPGRLILMQVLMIPLVIVFVIIFSFLAAQVGDFELGSLQIRILSDTWLRSVAIGLVWLAGLAGTIVLHELVHGITMKRFGAWPQYGVLWRYLAFYATSPGYAFRRNSYLTVALAPLVVISLLAVLGMVLVRGTEWVVLLALCGIINGSGAIGDLWMSSIALRYPRDAYVVDEKDGFRILVQDQQD